MAQKFIEVINWEVRPSERCIISYSKIDNQCVVSRYYIQEYEVLSYQEGFRIKCNWRILNIPNGQPITDEMWVPCNLLIKIQIENHSYRDKRCSYITHIPNILQQCSYPHLYETYQNVVERLKSTGAKFL